jgi:hypothetical protein
LPAVGGGGALAAADGKADLDEDEVHRRKAACMYEYSEAREHHGKPDDVDIVQM